MRKGVKLGEELRNRRENDKYFFLLTNDRALSFYITFEYYIYL